MGDLSKIILPYVLALMAAAGLLVSLIIWGWQGAIDHQQLHYLNTMLEQQPELAEVVREFYEDGVLTVGEFYHIKKVSLQLNKQDEIKKLQERLNETNHADARRPGTS